MNVIKVLKIFMKEYKYIFKNILYSLHFKIMILLVFKFNNLINDSFYFILKIINFFKYI